MKYSDTNQPKKTMTDAERRALLTVTGEHRDGFRDHVIFSCALGTALREHEIAALNVGDVSPDGKAIRRRFPLTIFKGCHRTDGRGEKVVQEAIIPDALKYKLEKFLRLKAQLKESLDPSAPLFISRHGERIAARTMRRAFAVWQERAGLERTFTFHELRHTALTNMWRVSKDLTSVQRLARHASAITTTIYMHSDDESVLKSARSLPC